MTSERPPEDELEPTAEEEAQPADEMQDGVDAADDANAELDADEGLDDEDLDAGSDAAVEPRASAPVAGKPMAQVRGQEPRHRGAESPHVAVSTEDELPYIDDRVSKIWVAAIVGVFLLILVYGLLFGKSGALTPPTPSPTPSPTATPTLSASPVPSSSLTPAPSITITPTGTIPHDGPQQPPTPTPAPSS